MTVDQMLYHLNLAIGSGLGYYTLPDKSTWMTRTIHQWVIFRLLKRFPISVKTPTSLEVTSPNWDFEAEKQQLKDILNQITSDADWSAHPYFGTMTRETWGRLVVIHCNHHFQQFGY